MARGQPAEAIPHFQRAGAGNTAARFNLIRAYLQAGRKTEGFRLIKELSLRSKDDVQLHFTLGVLLASEKQYQAAELELERRMRSNLKPSRFCTTLGKPTCEPRNMERPS